jgi:hypothetical protein
MCFSTGCFTILFNLLKRLEANFLARMFASFRSRLGNLKAFLCRNLDTHQVEWIPPAFSRLQALKLTFYHNSSSGLPNLRAKMCVHNFGKLRDLNYNSRMRCRCTVRLGQHFAG